MGCHPPVAPCCSVAHPRRKRINALSVDDGTRTTWDFPEVVGSFGLCRSGRLVVALRHHVVLFDTRTREITNLSQPVSEPPTNRLNDGKVGPDGCFWVGSMDENTPRQKTAALYRITPDGRTERKSEGYAVSNGLAWSPNGRVMYHSDSTAVIIEAWDFDPQTGAMTHQRTLATLTNEDGRPDGAATDVDGNYWSAVAHRQPSTISSRPTERRCRRSPSLFPDLPCPASPKATST